MSDIELRQFDRKRKTDRTAPNMYSGVTTEVSDGGSMRFSYDNFLYLGTTLAILVMTPKLATCFCILSHMYKTKLRTAACDDGRVTQCHWEPPN